MMMGIASSAQTSLSNEQYNDILLQERLHEAKAMIRKSESGAVMHKFSLWNKVSKEANNDSSCSGSIISVNVSAVMEQSTTTYQSVVVAAAAAASSDEELIQREREKSLLSLDAPIVSETIVQDQSTSSSSLKESPPLRNPSSSVTSTSTIEHQGPKKKSSQVRGPKVAIKVNRGIHRDSDTDNYRSDEVSHHAHKGTRTSSALVYPSLGNSSTGITVVAATASLVTASCDVDDEIEEEVKEPRSRSGSDYMMSSGGGLASSLRSKVVVAKQMSSSSTSLNTIDSAVAVVDSMMDACDGRTSNAADSSPDVFEPIDELTELQNSNNDDGDYYEISDEYDDDDNENESLSSVEEDEELRRYYMSRRKSMDDISIKFNEIDFDQNSVVHVMSQSGPATFANYSKSNPTLSIQQQQHGQSSSSSMTNHSGKDIHVSNNDATSTVVAAFHHNGNDNHRMMRRINSNESITNSIVDETLRRESISTMAAFRSSNELLLSSLPTSTNTINSGSSSVTSSYTPLEHISYSNIPKSTSKYEKLKNLRANSARKKDSIHEGVVTKLYEDAHEALSEDQHHVAIKPYDHPSQIKVMSSHSMVPVEKIPLTDPISNSSISREDYANSPTLSELSDIDELSLVHNNINNNNNNYNNNNNNNNNNKRNMYGYNNENHNINNSNNYNNNNITASHINNFKDQLNTTSSHSHHHVSHHLMESTSNRYHYDNNVIHSKETHGDAVVGVTDRDSNGIESPPLQWRKGEVIGEGTFGKVFKGLNERTGELIAIKQLCLFDSSDSKEIQSLRKEISVMWNLEHENIVR